MKYNFDIEYSDYSKGIDYPKMAKDVSNGWSKLSKHFGRKLSTDEHRNVYNAFANQFEKMFPKFKDDLLVAELNKTIGAYASCMNITHSN